MSVAPLDAMDNRVEKSAGASERRDGEEWKHGAPGSGRSDDPARGLDHPDDKGGRANPGHGAPDRPHAPKGRGDGELKEQPSSTSEARDPGADSPRFDE